MTRRAIVLAHLIAMLASTSAQAGHPFRPVLPMDAAALADDAVTGGPDGAAPTGGIAETIASPPVSLLRVTQGLVADATADDEHRVAIELDRASRALKASEPGR